MDDLQHTRLRVRVWYNTTCPAYLEAFAPAQDKIAHRHANVLVYDFTVSLRRIIVPKDAHGAHNLDTRGIGRYNDYALLTVLVGVVGVTLAKNQVQGTARIASTADVPVIRA